MYEDKQEIKHKQKSKLTIHYVRYCFIRSDKVWLIKMHQYVFYATVIRYLFQIVTFMNSYHLNKYWLLRAIRLTCARYPCGYSDLACNLLCSCSLTQYICRQYDPVVKKDVMINC